MDTLITTHYGRKLRVRICGLCWRDGEVLMVNHRGLTSGDFWALPGGGLDFLESAGDCLKRELLEETGLIIAQPQFQFACEFLQDPLHAIELYFGVAVEGGELKKGEDPEMAMISEVRFMSPEEVAAIPEANRHGIFNLVPSPGDLKTLTGFFRI